MTALAAEVVKWSALGKEALIALVGGVGVVFAYGLVVIGATRFQASRRDGRTATATVQMSLAVVGGLVCAAAIIVGIIAMSRKS